jgi:hypothetical protein
MRWIAFALLMGLLVLDSSSAPPAAEKEKSSALQLEESLRDGSRIKGETTPSGPLEVTSPVVGQVSIPLAKVSAITFSDDHEQATLRLQNGDKLQGVLSIQSVKLTTVFGPITIPLTAIKELQIYSSEGGTSLLSLDDWEPVPFPENSDWPSSRGEPAQVADGVVSLHGRPFRSKRTCGVPLTFECGVVLSEMSNPETAFHVNFVHPDQPRNLNLVRYVSVNMNCRSAGYGGLQRVPAMETATGFGGLLCTPAVDVVTGFGRPRTVWSGESFPLQIGKTYHLKAHVTSSEITVTINDNEYRIQEAGVAYKEVLLDLWGWQPSSTWQVKNLRVY